MPPYQTINPQFASKQIEIKQQKPIDSFLGSDYVHNFIQDHQDVMGNGWGKDSNGQLYATPSSRIDEAYITQSNKGSNVNSEVYNLIRNRQYGDRAETSHEMYSTATITPNNFPNRSTYLKQIQDPNSRKSLTGVSSYLPSQGYYAQISRRNGKDLIYATKDYNPERYNQLHFEISNKTVPLQFNFQTGGTLNYLDFFK